ncbi:hypothetical protein BXT86_01765 [candidate division WOR-3 bacterium 4484_100]|uniref:M23ase beta-sheet core domain-containing protein n=1 Tax=candidate division WOR-3 bacterium 4484_100 TaxID=1936077 RepID=A0A1V4QHW5_UNCW3|nr:MAG: hypothetical protein BXT86_01765 [candidate division WOR-3 bacterium 4484_100]
MQKTLDFFLIVYIIWLESLLDIILVSSRGNKTLNLHIKFIFILLLGMFILGILGFFIYSVVFFATNEVDQNRLRKLRTENQIVHQELMRIENEIANLNNIIDSLALYDKKLRVYAPLTPINEDLRKAGVGGYTPHYNDKEISPRIKDKLTDISQTLDNILAQARVQQKSFNELYNYLEEKRYMQNHTPSIIPVQGWLIRGFGYHIDPFTGKVKMHEGLDIAAPIGTPIVAPADGVVKYTGTKRGFGLTVELDHGYGYSTLFAHCQRIKVIPGMKVKRGDIIAYVGNTGKSTGPHLHYEVHIANRPVDPIRFILTKSVISD